VGEGSALSPPARPRVAGGLFRPSSEDCPYVEPLRGKVLKSVHVQRYHGMTSQWYTPVWQRERHRQTHCRQVVVRRSVGVPQHGTRLSRLGVFARRPAVGASANRMLNAVITVEANRAVQGWLRCGRGVHITQALIIGAEFTSPFMSRAYNRAVTARPQTVLWCLFVPMPSHVCRQVTTERLAQAFVTPRRRRNRPTQTRLRQACAIEMGG